MQISYGGGLGEASQASHHRSGGKLTLADSNVSNIRRRILGWIGGNKNELASSSDRLQQLHLEEL